MQLAGGVATTLSREAATLRTEAAAAQSLRQATLREAESLKARQASASAAAAALDQAMRATEADLAAAQSEGQAEAAQVASYGAQAGNLRDAIAAMDAARAAAVARAAREAAKAAKNRQGKALAGARAEQAALIRPPLNTPVGRFRAPVAAAVGIGYGVPGLAGPTTGITYAPAPGAYAVSPCAGRVAFAAPFRSYGQLIILECGGGIDVVLAGLGQINTAPGRPVHQGEPLGRLPGSGKSALYVEVRVRGEPVNPALYLLSPAAAAKP
jgi:septal ring factor EnvC (AmiA/AmiB activator)